MVAASKVFADVGMHNVSFVLATGNILFSSDKNLGELKRILENALSERFNYEAYLFIKTEREVFDIFNKNPFVKAEDFHIYACVGTKGIEVTLLEKFNNSIKFPDEKGKIENETFYWQISKGNTLDSNFGKVLGRKELKDRLTSRNINTLEKILKKF